MILDNMCHHISYGMLVRVAMLRLFGIVYTLKAVHNAEMFFNAFLK